MFTLITQIYGFDSESKWSQITFTNEVHSKMFMFAHKISKFCTMIMFLKM